MFAGFILLWLVNGKIKKEQAIHTIVASFIAWTVSETIKFLFPTLRPFQVEGTYPLTLTIPLDAGFPSEHTSIAFAVAMGVQRYEKKYGIIFIISAMLVGLGRILGNVHYFADIIGGAVVGIITVLALERVHWTGVLSKVGIK